MSNNDKKPTQPDLVNLAWAAVDPNFQLADLVIETETKDVVEQVSSTVTQTTSPTDRSKEHDNPLPLYTLRMSLDRFQEHASTFSQFRVREQYIDAIRLGAVQMQRTDVLDGSLKREGSDWQQSVDYEGMQLKAARPSIQSNKSGMQATSENAAMAIQRALGLGTRVTIPLWHSGIWLTLNTPTDAALLNLERQIAEEKITLGRDTSGALFSNNLSYLIRHVFNFVLQHVYTSTLETTNAETLSKLIRVTDLPTIWWGMALAIYPNGFDHAQPCTLNPDRCQHIVKDRLQLALLQWTDRSRLTNKQRKHMANRIAKYTEKEIQEYQSEGSIGDGRTLDMGNNVTFVLRIPTVEEYVATGVQWVDSIVDMVNSALSNELGSQDRDEFVSEHSRLVSMRQYSHWVKAIRMSIDGNEVEVLPGDDMDDLINRMSGDDDLVNIFLEGIKNYIADATISVIGLPSYKCPNCEGDMTPEESKHPYLVQLDSLMTFFTLRGLRLLRAKS